jgi:hypothetical protein
VFALQGGPDDRPFLVSTRQSPEPSISMTPLAARRLPRACLVALIAVAALAVGLARGAAPAHASPNQIAVMMDDDHLLYRGNQVLEDTLRQMALLGVDRVRVTVLWSVVAENARSTAARRKRFKPADPATYPPRNWDRYDQLVLKAQQYGVGVFFNVTGPGPDWVHKKAPNRRDQKSWEPRAAAFHDFVAAVGKRYSGAYHVSNGCRCTLPAVRMWSVWNEPNQGGWLMPQWAYSKKLRKTIPYSPIIYRDLWYAGRRALQETGHGDDVIWVGETAPMGNSKGGVRTPMASKVFIRELFCLDSRMRRYKGKAAKARKCSTLKRQGPVKAWGWAHHPYTKKLSPTRRSGNRNAITMANLGDLTGLLDAVAKKTGSIAPGLPVLLSEFGYETNPPDPYAGVSLAQQATWLNLGDYIAYQNPRIAGQTQFLLRDVEPLTQFRKGSKAYWFTYQSGLYTSGGQPKPSAQAYALPLVITKKDAAPGGGRYLAVWGQLKFRRSVHPGDSAQLQFMPKGGSAWTTVQRIPVTAARNFFESSVVATAPGAWRVLWQGAQQPFEASSRTVTINP